MSGPNISVAGISDVSALDLVEKLRVGQGDQLKTDGSIRIGSETYKVTYVPGEGGANKLQMKRNYTGFLIGPLLNLINRKKLATQATAVQLTNKVNDLMKTTEYKLVRNSYDKLMDIAKKFAPDKGGVIEVGHYGHSEPRNKIVSLGVVAAVNRSLAGTGKQIRLNKIDTYNDFLGVTSGKMLPFNYGKLMDDIANNRLKPNENLMESEQYSYLTVEKEDLKKWQDYIAKTEISDKIDIPKKLFRYLHPQEGQDDTNLIGWAKDFKNNPDIALRHFVIKNLSAKTMNSGFVDGKMIESLCDLLKNFVEAYNEKDPAERERKLADFNDPKNWKYTRDDKNSMDNAITNDLKTWCKKNGKDFKTVDQHNKDKFKEHWLKHNPNKAVAFSTHYRLFANILVYATFRQTSKIGLDFFRSQNKPVLFHMSDREMKDFGNTDWILNENHWKDGDGHLDQTYGGSEITHSEVRHANKLIDKFGAASNIWQVQGA